MAATVVIAIFAGLTWKVYSQIKGVMKDSFQSEFRPVVRVNRLIPVSPDRRKSRVEGVPEWKMTLMLQNFGKGHAVNLRARPVDRETGEGSETADLFMDLPAGEEGSRSVWLGPGWTKETVLSRLGVDVYYKDLYGNEFVTEWRDREQFFRRASSRPISLPSPD